MARKKPVSMNYNRYKAEFERSPELSHAEVAKKLGIGFLQGSAWEGRMTAEAGKQVPYKNRQTESMRKTVKVRRVRKTKSKKKGKA